MTRPLITTDPAVRFGKPAIKGISVDAIAGTVWAGEDLDTIADDYGLTRPEILVACWHAARYGTRAQRARWRDWLAIASIWLWNQRYDAIPDPTHEGAEQPMSGADYALCDSCGRKVFYDADTDIPAGTVILHVDCALKEQAAAEQRGYDKAIARLRDDDRFWAWDLERGQVGAYVDRRDLAVDYLEAVRDQP